jgi:hypothetical protein
MRVPFKITVGSIVNTDTWLTLRDRGRDRERDSEVGCRVRLNTYRGVERRKRLMGVCVVSFRCRYTR